MKIKVKYLYRLLDELASKHNVINEKKGLEDIADHIGITREYIYKKIANPISRMRQHESLGLRDGIIKKILKDIGFDHIGAFCDFVDSPVSEQALSLVGSYYSYVRRNTKEGALLRSPVLIFKKDNKIHFLLNGDRTEYSGIVDLHHGVLSLSIQNEEGKFFNHVYKIGSISHPKVLQGVFSGVTSTFDPIGGRVVLEHRNEKFADLKTGLIDISDLKRSASKNEKLLALYFAKYEDNNLQVKKSTSFNLSDLE
jgi:hypothetical protein